MFCQSLRRRIRGDPPPLHQHRFANHLSHYACKGTFVWIVKQEEKEEKQEEDEEEKGKEEEKQEEKEKKYEEEEK